MAGRTARRWQVFLGYAVLVVIALSPPFAFSLLDGNGVAKIIYAAVVLVVLVGGSLIRQGRRAVISHGTGHDQDVASGR